MIDDYGAGGGIRIDRKKRSYLKKICPIAAVFCCYACASNKHVHKTFKNIL
jgi:hypothetical protein